MAAYDSHQNLMRGHNQYRELFETQAKHYRAEGSVAQTPDALV